MGLPRHPKKDIEYALEYAEEQGWTVTSVLRGHRWGVLACPTGERVVPVWSTPKSPTSHAMNLRRRVDRCQHDVPEAP